MKKITVMIFSFVLMLNMAACSSQSNGGDTTAAPSAGETVTSEGTQENAGQSDEAAPEETDLSEPETENGKTLVVYYSASGNTETAANYIAAATNADVFEIQPVEPYSDADLDWTDNDSRVVYEHDNPDAREVELVESGVPDWAAYDTVFIGFPIWWGIAAWPVNGFIEANDFTGKTVIPFCTSASSGLGDSGRLLAEAAGTGNWLEGERFSSGVSEDAVKAWVEELGLD